VARFALSAIGRDRPGIVAGVSGALLEHGANIEDSRMAILGGHFTIMLIVSTPPDADVAALTRDLDDARGRLGLGALTLEEVADEHGLTRPEASHIVTVYGADHPGIVHAVAAALAKRGANILDLETRVAGDLYVMTLDVAAEGDIDDVLEQAAAEQGVELSVRPFEADVL